MDIKTAKEIISITKATASDEVCKAIDTLLSAIPPQGSFEWARRQYNQGEEPYRIIYGDKWYLTHSESTGYTFIKSKNHIGQLQITDINASDWQVKQ